MGLGSSKDGPRSVILRGFPSVDEQRQASTAIIPGHLIEINTGKFRPHATKSGHAAGWFALERDELGKGIDTAYAANDIVKAGFFAAGDCVNAIIASGENVTEGAELESDGTGRLTAGTTQPVARAADAGVATSTGDYRLEVIIL